MSVKKIDEKEIITTREAKEKYEKHHMGFVVTEPKIEDPDNEKGYVVCLLDSYDEGFKISRKTGDGKFISILSGYAVGGTEIGGVCFD